MRLTLCAAFFGLAIAGAGCKSDTDRADNTGRNDPDRTTSAKTADQSDKGLSDDGDLQLTQQIRQAVVADDSLSMNARNAKIIVEDQVVTLRGPVASTDEKAALERIAVRFAGTRRVVNELEIAP